MASKGNTRHIRRLASTRYMKLKRKAAKYVVRPMAGRHSGRNSISLATVLKEKMMDATSRDVRYLLNRGEVEVNGRTIREERYPLGFGDTIHLKPSRESYRVASAKHGVFSLEKAEEKQRQAFKVVGKHVVRGGRVSVRLHDGSVIIADNKIKVNDSVILGKKGVEKVIPFEAGRECYVVNGTHACESGRIKEITRGTMLRDATVRIEGSSGEFETLLKNVMVTGD